VDSVTVVSHILLAQQGIRTSRPADHRYQRGGSGLSHPFRHVRVASDLARVKQVERIEGTL